MIKNSESKNSKRYLLDGPETTDSKTTTNKVNLNKLTTSYRKDEQSETNRSGDVAVPSPGDCCPTVAAAPAVAVAAAAELRDS
jgi:hypothetical protein